MAGLYKARSPGMEVCLMKPIANHLVADVDITGCLQLCSEGTGGVCSVPQRRQNDETVLLSGACSWASRNVLRIQTVCTCITFFVLFFGSIRLCSASQVFTKRCQILCDSCVFLAVQWTMLCVDRAEYL